jgi:uncharacterized protein (DUF486 family)
MKAFYTIGLLVMSNIFMTLAWYGHLKFKDMSWGQNLGLFSIILISWGLAFFEYNFMIPANRIGYEGHGGPFTLLQLRIIQEVVSLTVFTIIAIVVFKTETFTSNHLIGFGFLILAVYFIFKK